MEKVQSTVEHAVMSWHTIETYSNIMSMACEIGLELLTCASQALELREFDAFTSSAGFEDLGEELVGSLLEDDKITKYHLQIISE